MDNFNVKNLNGVTWISSENFGGQAATDQLFEAWKALATRFVETARIDSADEGANSDSGFDGSSAAFDTNVFIQKHDLLDTKKKSTAVLGLEPEPYLSPEDVNSIWDKLMREPSDSEEAMEIDLDGPLTDGRLVQTDYIASGGNGSVSAVVEVEGIVEEPEDGTEVAKTRGLIDRLPSQSATSSSSTACPSDGLTIQEVPAEGSNSSEWDKDGMGSNQGMITVSPLINQEQSVVVAATSTELACYQAENGEGKTLSLLETCLKTLRRCDRAYNQAFRDIEVIDAHERPWDRPKPRFYKPRRERGKELMLATIMQDLGYETEVSRRLEQLISVDHSSSPFIDRSLLAGLSMPLIGPPIPASAIRNSAALAALVSESSRIGRMQGGPPGSTTLALNNLLLWKNHKQGLQHQHGSGSATESTTGFRDCIFRVCFYHPVGYATTQKSYTQLVLSCKIDILGQQTLQDLRKALYCRLDGLEDEIDGNDLPLNTEFSLQQSERIREHNMSKPCAFFIGSTVYQNKQGDETTYADFAQKINSWNKFVRIEKTSYTRGEMEATKLIDLDFQMGFPYGFFHLNCCEHILTIDSVRLVHTKTSLNDLCPRIRHLNKALLPCEIDGGRMARYVVNGFKKFLWDTMLVCHECLEIACYQDGKKVDDFRLCRFHQVVNMKNVDVNGISTGQCSCEEATMNFS